MLTVPPYAQTLTAYSNAGTNPGTLLSASAALTDVSPGAATANAATLPYPLNKGNLFLLLAAGFLKGVEGTLKLGLYWGGTAAAKPIAGTAAVKVPVAAEQPWFMKAL